jgi:hypothetical protein
MALSPICVVTNYMKPTIPNPFLQLDSMKNFSFVGTDKLLINYLTKASLSFPLLIFCCGAATQRGSWPPHS